MRTRDTFGQTDIGNFPVHHRGTPQLYRSLLQVWLVFRMVNRAMEMDAAIRTSCKIHHRTRRASWLLVTLSAGLLLGHSVDAFDAAALSQTKLRSVVVPIYLPGAAQAAGVIRVEKVFKDSQRRGFFRIGLFPVAVFENVRCQINQTQDMAAVLSEMAGLARLVRDTKGVEFRSIEWGLAGASQPVVEARGAAPSAGGTWRLSGGVTFRDGDRVTHLPAATLFTTGKNEVQLVWNAGGRTNQMILFKTVYPIQKPTRKPS